MPHLALKLVTFNSRHLSSIWTCIATGTQIPTSSPKTLVNLALGAEPTALKHWQ